MKKNAILLGATLLVFLSALSYAQAPVPFINLPLVPDATAPGGPEFTLTVNGTGFVSNSVVNWNGTPLATQFVTQGQLRATIPAANIATASTGWVTVVNPASGDGTSNTAFFAVTTNTGKSLGFDLASFAATGNAPQSVAVGDFNGDGNLDLAVANYGSGTVSVLLGDGKGNFTLASSPACSAGPDWVAVGDFNGDGKLDLAVANFWGWTVSVFLGDGTGNFTLASSPAVPAWPTSVVAGDFNGDGKLDLAVVSYSYPKGVVSVLLGDGTGNFTVASSLNVGTNPVSAVVGDFNGDGKLDLAVANGSDGTVSILLGDGTGNFTLASTLTYGGGALAVADFNGDGKLDLAVGNGNSTSVLLGDGTGNFTLASSPPYSGSLAVGDFNADGKLDLAITSNLGGGQDGTVSVLLGENTGNFTFGTAPFAGVGPLSVAVGDFNGDGVADLAVVDIYAYTVSVLLGTAPAPAVTFYPTNLTFGTELIGTGSSPQSITLANSSTVPLKITKISASWNFSQTNNCSDKLAPNGQCTINATFTPHALDTLTGTVTITDDGPNSPQTVSLSGTSTAVSLSPTSLNFGNQPVGTTSPPQTVTFTNYANRPLQVLGVGFTGPNAPAFAQTNTCGTSVPAGGSCTISITFTPKRKAPYTATLGVSDNGGGSPQTVALSGTGT